MDALSYTYKGNQLQSVSEGALTGYGFKGRSSNYSYDVNGNMLTDTGKGIHTITYNHLNLPTQVSLSQGNIEYLYDATGLKLKKTVGSNVTAYTGATVYKNGELELIHTPEGYVEPLDNGYRYIYRLQDHLGNTRVSFAKDTATGSTTLIETNDYYPFGLEHGKQNSVSSSSNLGQNWKYNGKEIQTELGLDWYDYGARNYNASLGRGYR